MSAPRVPVADHRASSVDPPVSSHVRILIVSESLVLRSGMYSLLQEPPLVIVGVVPQLEQLPANATTKRAHVALVAPVGTLTRRLSHLLTDELFALSVVLLLTPAAMRIHGETLQAAGNTRCLPLHASRDAIVRSLAGGAFGPAGGLLTERISRGPGGRLTPRQQEVLDCLAHGRSNCEIAEQLTIAEDTVKAHLGVVYRKLGVKSRAAAITAYLETG